MFGVLFFISNEFKIYTIFFLQLSIYPNPSKGTIHVSMKTANPVYVMVYDVLGRLVYENKN